MRRISRTSKKRIYRHPRIKKDKSRLNKSKCQPFYEQVPEDTIDKVMFIYPNETYPEKFSGILRTIKDGTLISVGTLRGLIDASYGHFEYVILLDYNKKAVELNKLNIELIRVIDNMKLTVQEKRLQYFSTLYGHWLTSKQLKLLKDYDLNGPITPDFLRIYTNLFESSELHSNEIDLDTFPLLISKIIRSIQALDIIEMVTGEFALLSRATVPSKPKYGAPWVSLIDPYYRFNYPVQSEQVKEYFKRTDIGHMPLSSAIADKYNYVNHMTLDQTRQPYYWENDEIWRKLARLVQKCKIVTMLGSIFNDQVFAVLSEHLLDIGQHLTVIDFSNALDSIGLISVTKREYVLSNLIRNLRSLPGFESSIVLQTLKNFKTDGTETFKDCFRIDWCYFWRTAEDFIKKPKI